MSISRSNCRKEVIEMWNQRNNHPIPLKGSGLDLLYFILWVYGSNFQWYKNNEEFTRTALPACDQKMGLWMTRPFLCYQIAKDIGTDDISVI